MDLVRIADGEVVMSQDLKHTTGNIISMAKVVGRPHEVVLGTAKGIFFATIGKGSYGLRKADIAALEAREREQMEDIHGRTPNQKYGEFQASVYA